MIRKISSLFFAAIIFASCGNQGNKDNASTENNGAESVKIEFSALTDHPDDFVGKEISVKGKVVHVCMHSGKKMFITGENPDIRLYIQAGEEMPKFPTELLGSEVEVKGMLTKLETVSEQPGKGIQAAEGVKPGSANAEECATELAVAGQAVLSDLMMVYNTHSVVK